MPNYKIKDRAGLRYGRLLVLSPTDKRDHKGVRCWNCRCDCGNVVTVGASDMVRGHTRSCGCLEAETRRSFGTRTRVYTVRHNLFAGLPKHKRHGTSIYRAWECAKARCCNPTHPAYPRYGARGITMCGRWLNDVVAFVADMGERPPNSSLDRIDNNGGYWCGHCEECLREGHPANCRWATRIEQANNRYTNLLVTRDGVQEPLSIVARRLGVRANYVAARARRLKTTVEESLAHFVSLKNGDTNATMSSDGTASPR